MRHTPLRYNPLGRMTLASLRRLRAGRVATVPFMVSGLALAVNAAVRQEVRSGNPILPGWYADPEAHVFEGRHWLYPTYSARYNEQVFMA